MSLTVTVRDAAGTVFVAIPETPYDASDLATVARPIGLPIAAGHAAEVEVRVRLRDGEGRTRCFIARASVSVQHAQETSLELAPQEAACE